MSTYKEVKVGDSFKPSASMHNDLVRMLNSVDGPKSVATSKNSNGATVLKVYNPTDVDFAPGTPVNFDNESELVEEHVPIKSYSDEQAPWGVLKDGLQAGCFGSCIVSGPVTVTLSGEGKYAVPSESGFELADEAPEGNSALVLYSNNTNTVICLGAGGDKKEDFSGVVTLPDYREYNFMYLVEIGKKKRKEFCIIPLKHYNLNFRENDTILVDPFDCQLIPVYSFANNKLQPTTSMFVIKYPINYTLSDDADFYGVGAKYLDGSLSLRTQAFGVYHRWGTAVYCNSEPTHYEYSHTNCNFIIPDIKVKINNLVYDFSPSSVTPSIYGEAPMWYSGDYSMVVLDNNYLQVQKNFISSNKNLYLDVITEEEYTDIEKIYCPDNMLWNKPIIGEIQSGNLTVIGYFTGERPHNYYSNYNWSDYEGYQSVVGIYMKDKEKESYLVGFKVYLLKNKQGENLHLVLSVNTDKFFIRNTGKVFAQRRSVFKNSYGSFLDLYKEDFYVKGNHKQKIVIEKDASSLDGLKYTYIDESEESTIYKYELKLNGVVSSCNDNFCLQTIYIGRVPIW